MIGAAALVAAGIGDWLGRSVVALSLALALVLDTADGRLARLQGTSSAFGQWLDQVVDELADLALHAAIAWAAFRSDGSPIWLVVGIIYASGKYLFLVQSLLGNELEEGEEQATRLLLSAMASVLESSPRSQRARPDCRSWFDCSAMPTCGGICGLYWHLWAGSTSHWRLMPVTSCCGLWPA